MSRHLGDHRAWGERECPSVSGVPRMPHDNSQIHARVLGSQIRVGPSLTTFRSEDCELIHLR